MERQEQSWSLETAAIPDKEQQEKKDAGQVEKTEDEMNDKDVVSDQNTISAPNDGNRMEDQREGKESSIPEKPDYGMSLLQDSIYYDDEIQIDPHLINSLTEGFTEKFLPSLEKNRKTIAQIKSSQNVLVETVHQENAKFKDCLAMEGLEKTMTKAKLYHAKLLKLRRDMTALHDKSAKLKRRALRLQQQKQKEELTRAQQLEAEYEKEKMITARVAPSSPTSSPTHPPSFSSTSSSSSS